MKQIRKNDHAHLAQELLMQLCEAGVSPVFTEESWYVWALTHWREIPRQEVKRCVITVSSWATWEGNSPIRITDSLTRSVVSLAESLAFDPAFFDAESVAPGVSFLNGFLRMTQFGFSLEPHSPDQRARHAYRFNWDANAQCPRWERFLERVWTSPPEAQDQVVDRAQRIDFLAQFVGGAMCGRAHIGQRAVILTGTGANGKSILCDVVRALFPPGSVTSVPPQDLSTPERVSRLAGARLNLVADIPERGLKDTGLVKQVISGDYVDARRLYQASFTFRPVAGNMFSANTLPSTSDFSTGFLRRWVILTFPVTFTGANARPSDQLVAELLEEMPGIVAWAIRGQERFMKDSRYVIPDSSIENVHQWRMTNDVAALFVEERCYVFTADEGDMWGPQSSLIYDDYKQWAKDRGHHPMSQRTFSERLRVLGIRTRRLASGREWGMRLKTNEEAGRHE